MMDPIIFQRPAQWSCDVILADDLAQCLGAVGAIESQLGTLGAWCIALFRHLVTLAVAP